MTLVEYDRLISEYKARAKKYGERFFKYEGLFDKALNAKPWNGNKVMEMREKMNNASEFWDSAVYSLHEFEEKEKENVKG